jgi:sec-independent protein translocase protein TatA
MIGNIVGPDLGIIILIVIVVLLGGSQLPKIARNVGLAGREFRKAQEEAQDEAEKQKAAKEAAAAAINPPPAPDISPPPTAPGTGEGEGSITLTPAQLDALLKAREEQVRKGESTSG